MLIFFNYVKIYLYIFKILFMTGLKISKFGKYSDLNIIYELENDDFIVKHLLTLDDSWPNTKINIWYYLDIKSEKRDIFIYSLNNSW